MIAFWKCVLAGVTVLSLSAMGVQQAYSKPADQPIKQSTNQSIHELSSNKLNSRPSARSVSNGSLSALTPHPSMTSLPAEMGKASLDQSSDQTINQSNNQSLKQPTATCPAAHMHLPVYDHPIVFPPNMPPAITHDGPMRVRIDMNTFIRTRAIDDESTFDWWSFNGHSPGPVIRLRQQDVLEVHFTNCDQTGMQHNIDFHAVQGQIDIIAEWRSSASLSTLNQLINQSVSHLLCQSIN